MRRVIAGINMTLDGFCDHTSIGASADDELHDHYSDLLASAGDVLYGRITYLLMEDAWPKVVQTPTGHESTDEFAVELENVSKIVFSHTLKKVNWKNVRLAERSLKEEVLDLRQRPGNDILIGSRSLIVALLNLNLVDEFQLCIHPVIAGKGLPLLKGIDEKIDLKLARTKTFGSGAILNCYQPNGK